MPEPDTFPPTPSHTDARDTSPPIGSDAPPDPNDTPPETDIPPKPRFNPRSVLVLTTIFSAVAFAILFMNYTVKRSRQTRLGDTQKQILRLAPQKIVKSIPPDAPATPKKNRQPDENLFFQNKILHFLKTGRLRQAQAMAETYTDKLRFERDRALERKSKAEITRATDRLAGAYLLALRVELKRGRLSNAQRAMLKLVELHPAEDLYYTIATELLYSGIQKATETGTLSKMISPQADIANLLLDIGSDFLKKQSIARARAFLDAAEQYVPPNDAILRARVESKRAALQQFIDQRDRLETYPTVLRKAETAFRAGDFAGTIQTLAAIAPPSPDDSPDIENFTRHADALRRQADDRLEQQALRKTLADPAISTRDKLLKIVSYRNAHPTVTLFQKEYDTLLASLENDAAELNPEKISIENYRNLARGAIHDNPLVALNWAEYEIRFAGDGLRSSAVQEALRAFAANQDIFTRADRERPDMSQSSPEHDRPAVRILNRYRSLLADQHRYDAVSDTLSAARKQLDAIPIPDAASPSGAFFRHWRELVRIMPAWRDTVFIAKAPSPTPSSGKHAVTGGEENTRRPHPPLMAVRRQLADQITARFNDYVTAGRNIVRTGTSPNADMAFSALLSTRAAFLQPPDTAETFSRQIDTLSAAIRDIRSSGKRIRTLFPAYLQTGAIRQTFVLTRIAGDAFSYGPMAFTAEKRTSPETVTILNAGGTAPADDFFMLNTEVTAVLFRSPARLIAPSETPSTNAPPSPADAMTPITGVSPKDARAFCVHLTQLHRALGMITAKQRYSLPTLQQWLRAAGGGKDTRRLYPWGTEWDSSRAVNAERGDIRPLPAGSLKSGATPDGIDDMAGNVAEWVIAAGENGQDVFIAMGGSFRDARDALTVVSGVVYSDENHTADDIGFRIVLSVDK